MLIARFFKYLLVSVTLIVGKQSYGQGLTGDYYNDIYLKDFVLKRIDATVTLNGYNEGPAPGVSEDYFSIRWYGEIFIPKTDYYVFHFTVDDGIRVWIDEKKIIDEWREQETAHYKAKLNLDGNRYHAIRIEYFNTIINSILNLWWESPEDAYTIFGYEVYRSQRPIPVKYFRPFHTEPTKVDSVKSLPLPKPVIKKKKLPSNKSLVRKDSLWVKDKSIILKSILFAQSKPELLPASYVELDKLCDYLKKNTSLNITIKGHTDYAGDSLDNKKLSLQRAQAVANYLIRHAIARERIRTVGYGGSKPIAHEADRNLNRRVEIELK